MAEGLLEGVLGGEEQKIDPTESGTEPIVAAVAANLASQNSEVAADTSAMFRKQTEVLELQKNNLESEYEFFKSEAGPRLLALRLRTAFQLFFALLATVISLGVAVVIYDALSSRRVVMEPFETPPALATQGLTGKVVANGLLDELSRLQDATRSSVSAKRDLSGAWSNELELVVPEAGISLAELSRVLKARLGHDLHIGGDLIETHAGGLALTVRGDNVPPATFTGAADELHSLMTKAAEYIYAKSQPKQWATYLGNAGRFEEQIAFCRSAYTGSDLEDRAYLLTEWAHGMQRAGHPIAESLGLLRTAIKLKPDFWAAHHELQNALWALGDEEGAWQAAEEMRRLAGGRPGRARSRDFDNWDTLTWNVGEWLDAVVADATANAGVGTSGDAAGIEIADIYSRMHDWEAAEITLQTTHEDPGEPVVAALKHFVRGRLALEAGDPARAATEMEAFGAAYADPAASASIPSWGCWIAPAEEAAGHPDKADAVLNAAGTFVDCYRFRGDILEGRGDWPGAQKAYADAVRLAPDLPAAYYSWGVALAQHGDFSGAAAKLQLANQKGPHWADPLKAWGDVLMKQNQSDESLAKYDEALRYAPDWKQLKEAREAAVKLKT